MDEKTMNDLRIRVRLSLQRALLGEVTPNLRAVCVEVSPAEIHVWAYYDGPQSEAEEEDFDGSVLTQLVADFPYPEWGTPLSMGTSSVATRHSRWSGVEPLSTRDARRMRVLKRKPDLVVGDLNLLTDPLAFRKRKARASHDARALSVGEATL